MKSLRDLLKIVDRSSNVIRRDVLDNLLLDKHKERLVKKAKEIDPDFIQFPPLLQDTFLAFYKQKPELLPDDQILPEFLVNKAVIEKLQNTEAYEEIRKTTMLDDVNSAIATATFAEKLYEELRRKMNEIKEKTEEARRIFRDILQKVQSGGKIAQKDLKALENLGNDLKNTIQQIEVSEAIKKAKEDYDNVRSALVTVNSWGNQPGEFIKSDIEDAIKLADLLLKNRRILEIVKYLGKVKNCLRSTMKSKFKKEPIELHSVRVGNDIPRALPSEICKLIYCPSLFYKDFLERKLLQYELKNKEKEIKGPFVVCLDLSGSMTGIKEMWAKAVALATIYVALKEKRKWAIIVFESIIKDVKVFENKPSLGEVVDVISLRASGGTNFELPLREAVNIINTSKTFRKADILFITDGECSVSPEFLREFNKFKKRTETKVISVLIHGHPNVLREFSDEVIPIHNLNLESARVVFEKII